MSVTQKDIAQKLNISRSLVAHAMKGNPRVSEETRAKVFQAAAEMGYDTNTNQAARSLASRRYGQKARTGIIALMFPAAMDASPQQTPFFTPFFEGMENEAHDLGMDVCLCWVRPGQLPRIIREGNVDGVVACCFYEKELLEVQQLQLPLVTYQTVLADAHSVMADDRQGAYLTTRHLLEQQHRRIAFMGCKVDSDCVACVAEQLRLQGYLDAMREYGITPREEWIETQLRYPAANELSYCDGCGECAACVGWDILKSRTSAEPVTAVVCHNDAVAMGIVDHARQDGVEVPRQLSVVGFDDISGRYHFQPTITSVQFSRYEMGRCALRIIGETNKTKGGHIQPQHHVFPVTLKEHGSTAFKEKNTEVMAMAS